MNIDIPYYFFKLLETDATTFIYQGDFSDELTAKAIRLGEHSTRNVSVFNRLRKKISFLIIECLQNVIRYEEKPELVHKTNNRPGTFMIRNIENSYYINSSNLIKNEKTEGLKTKLKNINELGNEELKNLKRDVLTNKTFSEKGGAGLGLLEMTRKSEHKLEYDFEYINFYLSCFYLQVKLVANENTNEYQSVTLNDSKDLYHKILDKNVMLLYKGDFSQQSMLPVLGMIESNLERDSKQYDSQKKMFYLLVELLQNMSKHGLEQNELKKYPHYGRQGILVICKKNQNYYIYSGNFIATEQADELKTYCEKINGMDKKQLSALYKEHLFDGKVRAKGGAGLGLIDIGRYSADKPVFDFRAHDAASVFYSFGLSI